MAASSIFDSVSLFSIIGSACLFAIFYTSLKKFQTFLSILTTFLIADWSYTREVVLIADWSYTRVVVLIVELNCVPSYSILS